MNRQLTAMQGHMKKSSDKESLKECLMACRCNHDERAFERRREYFKIAPEEAKKIADELSSCSRSDAICQFETMLDEWDPGMKMCGRHSLRNGKNSTGRIVWYK